MCNEVHVCLYVCLGRGEEWNVQDEGLGWVNQWEFVCAWFFREVI